MGGRAWQVYGCVCFSPYPLRRMCVGSVIKSAEPEQPERAHQHQGPRVRWLPPVPTCVVSGLRPVSMEERDGPQTAICTYECCIADPPPSRKNLSMFGVSTSSSLKERPNCARRSSTAMKSTFMAPRGGGLGGGGDGSGAGGGGFGGSGGGGAGGGSQSHQGSLHHHAPSQWARAWHQSMRVHGGADALVSVLAEMFPSRLSQRTLCPSDPIVPGQPTRGSGYLAVKLALPLAWSTMMGAVMAPGCGCPRQTPPMSHVAAAPPSRRASSGSTIVRSRKRVILRATSAWLRCWGRCSTRGWLDLAQ